MNKHSFDYFASCPTGLEELLEKELRDCGAETVTLQRGGAAFTAQNASVALRAILQSRVASRVFKELYSFECHNEKSMYQELCDIKWKTLMDVFQTFRLTTIYGKLPHDREVFTNSQFTTLKAKDAIVDWFNHNHNRRPSVEKDHPDISYLIRVDDAHEGLYKVQLMLDLCGNPLSNRGYRRVPTEAPVRENLAAGILMLLNWEPKEEGLVDGMCGSGTFLIEGAMIAGGVSPQWLKLKDWKKNMRPWAFLSHQWFTKDKQLQEDFNADANEVMARDREGIQRLETEMPTLTGGDFDERVLQAAKENIRVAGMSKLIPLIQSRAELLPAPAKKTLFICNPPYGERLQAGEDEQLRTLYHDMGENWKKNWKGHRAGVLTGNLPLLKSISLRSSRKISLYNGDIECRVAEYKLF
jgi:23S rRNA G2445 N2-methylase RlmL